MKTILLVEDERIIALSESKMLEKHGYQVLPVSNGREAVTTVEENRIDLILMDIDLGPGEMDGTEAAEIIVERHDIPVLFLSSHTEPEIVEKTEKITSFGYVVKNTGETVLINSIKMAFRLHESFCKEKEHEQLMSSMIAASPVAIHGIDINGNVILWNESSEKMFGWNTEEVLGKPLPIIPKDKRSEHHVFRKRSLSGEPLYRKEVVRCRKDGSLFFGSLSTSPLYNDRGEIFGIVAIMEDITRQNFAELELEKEKYRLTAILDGTNVGTWEWNVQTGETRFNERWAAIIGYTLDELYPQSIETWKRFTHPDDLQRSNDVLTRHFGGELPFYEFEGRMQHKTGEWIWVLDKGKVATWTDDGKPLWMYGTHQDITRPKTNRT